MSPDLRRDLDRFCEARRSIFYPKADLALPESVLRVLRGEEALEPDPFTPAQIARACESAIAQKPMRCMPLSEQGTFHRLFRLELADGKAVILRASAFGDVFRDFPLYVDGWAMEQLLWTPDLLELGIALHQECSEPTLAQKMLVAARTRFPGEAQFLREAP